MGASILNMAAKMQGQLLRWRGFCRFFTNGQQLRNEFISKLQEEEKHAVGTFSNWKKISLLVAFPVCGYLMYKTILTGEELHPDPDKYVPYSHLRIRNKAFPWRDGDKTLFHNPHANFGGAEAEEEVHEDTATLEKPVPLMTRLMMDYLMEDPLDNDRKRNTHMAEVRRRADEYLERKRHKKYSIEPINLDDILADTKRVDELSVDGY